MNPSVLGFSPLPWPSICTHRLPLLHLPSTAPGPWRHRHGNRKHTEQESVAVTGHQSFSACVLKREQLLRGQQMNSRLRHWALGAPKQTPLPPPTSCLKGKRGSWSRLFPHGAKVCVWSTACGLCSQTEQGHQAPDNFLSRLISTLTHTSNRVLHMCFP